MNEDQIRLALREIRGAVRENVSLRPETNVRIGGPARWFVEPLQESDVGLVIRLCGEHQLPLRVLGRGSNLLIGDQGVPGVVLRLSSLNRVVRDGNRVTAGAGVSLPTLLRGVRELGLAGLEMLTGIPASVGGVVAMNAGTREGETFDRLVSLTLVDGEGRIRILGKEDFQPSYRNGGIGDSVVVHATFELDEDDPKAIYARFESYLKYRNATQPVSQPSVGCVFRNPDGDSAGRLIERAGCKLLSRGGITVSGKHANYFVNEGEGTCAEFIELMTAVQERVRMEFGVELEPEVVRWNVPEL